MHACSYINTDFCYNLITYRFKPTNDGTIYGASSDGTVSCIDLETGISTTVTNLNPDGWQVLSFPCQRKNVFVICTHLCSCANTQLLTMLEDGRLLDWHGMGLSCGGVATETGEWLDWEFRKRKLFCSFVWKQILRISYQYGGDDHFMIYTSSSSFLVLQTLYAVCNIIFPSLIYRCHAVYTLEIMIGNLFVIGVYDF